MLPNHIQIQGRMGADYAHHMNLSPLNCLTFRRPCYVCSRLNDNDDNGILGQSQQCNAQSSKTEKIIWILFTLTLKRVTIFQYD